MPTPHPAWAGDHPEASPGHARGCRGWAVPPLPRSPLPSHHRPAPLGMACPKEPLILSLVIITPIGTRGAGGDGLGTHPGHLPICPLCQNARDPCEALLPSPGTRPMGGGAGGRQLLPKHFPRATPSPRVLGIHPAHLPQKPLPLISGFSTCLCPSLYCFCLLLAV